MRPEEHYVSLSAGRPAIIDMFHLDELPAIENFKLRILYLHPQRLAYQWLEYMNICSATRALAFQDTFFTFEYFTHFIDIIQSYESCNLRTLRLLLPYSAASLRAGLLENSHSRILCQEFRITSLSCDFELSPNRVKAKIKKNVNNWLNFF